MLQADRNNFQLQYTQGNDDFKNLDDNNFESVKKNNNDGLQDPINEFENLKQSVNENLEKYAKQKQEQRKLERSIETACKKEIHGYHKWFKEFNNPQKFAFMNKFQKISIVQGNVNNENTDAFINLFTNHETVEQKFINQLKYKSFQDDYNNADQYFESEKKIYQYLSNLQISTITHKHEAVNTVEEQYKIHQGLLFGGQTKNLFLRESKVHQHWLAVALFDTSVKLVDLAKFLNAKRFSFAEADKLKEYLDVVPGSVTPFGLINDKERKIKLVLDNRLFKHELLGFHPFTSTKTTIITINGFIKFLKSLRQSQEITVVDFTKFYEDKYVKAINYLPLTINNDPDGEFKYKHIIHADPKYNNKYENSEILRNNIMQNLNRCHDLQFNSVTLPSPQSTDQVKDFFETVVNFSNTHESQIEYIRLMCDNEEVVKAYQHEFLNQQHLNFDFGIQKF